MDTVSLVNSVRNFLATQHMLADIDWITGCVEFLTEDSTNRYNEIEIHNLSKEQWLLNDLKDICPGSLPSNLKQLKKTTLNGRYVLQINSALDIGTPAYQQFLKIQKVNTENIEATIRFEDKVSSHRMIKLNLTDGVQEISGIEYKPMRNLSCDVIPGSKLLLKGPVECRRGLILLTESAVELLGGEVQEIAASNSLAGLLSSKLGLPLNMTEGPHVPITPKTSNIPIPHAQMPTPSNDDQYRQTTDLHRPTVEQCRPVAIVTSIQVADSLEDDIDVDQLDAIEAQICSNPNKRSSEEVKSKPEKKAKLDSILGVNKVDDYPDEEDIFEDDDYLREMEAKFDASINELNTHMNIGPIAVSSEPYVYIKQINDMKETERCGRVFRVKGQIMKLLSKLSVGKDGWSLRCTIVDGTGSIDVDFTSAVLSKLVGYTPQEMNQLKKDMAKNPELKEKAVTALQKAKESLQVLYCIIELTMLDVPKITCLTPFEESHVDLLKKRLFESGL